MISIEFFIGTLIFGFISFGIIIYMVLKKTSSKNKEFEEKINGILEGDNSLINQFTNIFIDQNNRITDSVDRLADKSQEGSSKLLQIKENSDNHLKAVDKMSDQMTNRMQEMTQLTDLIKSVAAQSIGLKDILDNRQARGAISEIIMESIISNNLPQSHYKFQFSLSNKSRVDCALNLGKDDNKIICIDSKFPLDSYTKYMDKEIDLTNFKRDIKKHIKDISDKYIIEGETQDWAMMYIPSEVIFSFIHTECQDLIQHASNSRVIIVSGNTMLATALSIRSVIKDQVISNDAKKVKEKASQLLKEVERLSDRSSKLKTAQNKMNQEIDNINITSDKLVKQIKQIIDINVDE